MQCVLSVLFLWYALLLDYFMLISTKSFLKQEYIPVGCILPAAVAVHGGVCLSACWDTQPPKCGPETPRVWAWRPLWVWAWRLPRCGPGDPPTWPDPSASPLGVGLETPHTRNVEKPPTRHAGIPPPPWIPARHALISPAMHAGIPPPPWTEFLTHASEKITLPQTSFAGGKDRSLTLW